MTRNPIRIEIAVSTEGGGRTGMLHTPHGPVPTPAFMPVGTYGSVRGITPEQLRGCGVEMVLANAYHLALRPGAETIRNLGGLHRFMGWDGPILTDSGGFQMFSLAASVRVDEQGAVFRSHLDGARIQVTPESVVEIEVALGVDVGMVFDVVVETPGNRQQAADAAARTLRWAGRSVDAVKRLEPEATSIFGIQQGGLFDDLRLECAEALAELDMPGYAVGGLSVGEARDETMRTARTSVAMLPADKPRYMMGMGTPSDLVELAGWGYDLFDCVLPTRNARNGTLFTRDGALSIRNSRHGVDADPVEADCDCHTCSRFSRAYLHHLVRRKEMLGATLASIHNVHFYQRLMRDIRQALAAGAYEAFRREFMVRYQGADT
jgi:queuine tRNA-ribosyltransferase